MLLYINPPAAVVVYFRLSLGGQTDVFGLQLLSFRLNEGTKIKEILTLMIR